MSLSVTFVDQIISEELISSLLQLNNFKKTIVKDSNGNPLGLSRSVRCREIILKDSSIVNVLVEILQNANESYKFNLDYNNHEFRILKYDAGDLAHFDWHDDVYYDNPQKTNALTLIIGLNDDYEGGELDVETKIDGLKITKNAGVIFPSTMRHRVRHVTKGTRMVLAGWIRLA